VSQEDRDKWNARYRAGAFEGRPQANAFLLEALAARAPLRPGRALDLACGAGRNAVQLALLGFAVDALDISEVALERAADRAREAAVAVSFRLADLDDAESWPAARFDLVVMLRYVNAPLLRHAARRCLAPGGLLVVEEHLRPDALAPEQASSLAGPRSSAFRVAPGDLVACASGLEVLHAFEGCATDPDGREVCLARLVARRADADESTIGDLK
jgi:SAM-dependent methyltransferase